MRKVIGAGMFLCALTCMAQTGESVKYYKLDFVVKEIEATKVLHTRAYSMTVSNDKTSPGGSMRTGSKVPIPTTGDGKEIQFVEVGVNIDCRSVKEVDNQISLTVFAEVSSTFQEPAGPTFPVIRQNKWTSPVLVAFKKPTVVFSSDDSTSKRQVQLELTATPLK